MDRGTVFVTVASIVLLAIVAYVVAGWLGPAYWIVPVGAVVIGLIISYARRDRRSRG